jgi:hypothetical protein
MPTFRSILNQAEILTTFNVNTTLSRLESGGTFAESTNPKAQQ